MTDPRILACMRVADLPEPTLASLRGRCKVCGAQVWIARSSPPADLIYCVLCALDRMAETGESVEVQPPTRRQKADLERWRRRQRS